MKLSILAALLAPLALVGSAAAEEESASFSASEDSSLDSDSEIESEILVVGSTTLDHAQCLYNHHFDAGTFIIDQPGSSYK